VENDVQAARTRLLETVRSGDWERVPDQADAYAAAVRADERRRVVDDALEAIKAVFGDAPDPQRSAAGWRELCLEAIDRLH
jgi:hypothetical protein